MQKLPNRAAYFAMATLAGLALLIYYGKFIQLTGDFIYHYLLVDEIMRNGFVRHAAPNLGVMSVYPSGAHWLAALIGWAFGSGLVGIVIVSILSVYLCYLLILEIIGRNQIANVALAVAAFLLLRGTNSLIGWEVSINYFYSQLVTDVFLFAALLWLSKDRDLLHQAAFTAIVGAVAMCIHALGPIHLMGAGTLLVLYRSLKQWHDTKRFPRAAAGIVAGLVIADLAILALHPSFRAMRSISENDGYLEFGYTHLFLVTMLCALAGGLNLWRHWRGRAQAIDAVIGCAVLTSSFLATLQLIILSIGHDGSAYAVKKHLFIVFTLGVINLIRLVASLTQLDRFRWSAGWIVAPALAGIASFVALSKFDTPVAPVLSAINYAEYAAKYGFPEFVPGNTSDADRSQAPMIDFMISMSSFQHPLGAAETKWIHGADPAVGVKYVMVRRTADIDANCERQYAKAVNYSIVDADCLTQYPLGKVLDFRSFGDAKYFESETGWWGAEDWGTWSTGTASVNLRLLKNVKGPLELRVNARAFVSPAHPKQVVEVEANGKSIAQWVFDGTMQGDNLTAAIPADAVKDGQLHLTFRSIDAVSPSSTSANSPDSRVLGMGITTLTVVPQ